MAKKSTEKKPLPQKIADLHNDLASFTADLQRMANPENNTRMGPWTLTNVNNYIPLTLDRPLLDYSYMTQGLVQHAIDLPVDDAFRKGFYLEVPELDADEVKELIAELYRPRSGMKGGNTNISQVASRTVQPLSLITSGPSDIDTAIFQIKQVRLFGGGGLIVNTQQDFKEPLDVDAIKKGDQLEFIPADRWELILQNTNVMDTTNPLAFNYYGMPLHYTRVMKLINKEATSLIRQRLQGWGYSEVEMSIGAINQFVKFENLVFELLDEAKVDYFGIEGFNQLMSTATGSQQAYRRVAMANQAKSVSKCLIADKNDTWSQKTYTFAGLADIWNEVRRNLAAYLKIPMNKLFGESASGFGSGEDSMENYNGLIEIVRKQSERIILLMAQLRCLTLFGFCPKVITIKWEPMRILDGVEEQQVLNSKQTRIMERFMAGLITAKEATEIMKAEGIQTMDTEVARGEREVDPIQMALDKEMNKGGKPGNILGGDQRDKKRANEKDNREAR